jgi:hypothetical protein
MEIQQYFQDRYLSSSCKPAVADQLDHCGDGILAARALREYASVNQVL